MCDLKFIQNIQNNILHTYIMRLRNLTVSKRPGTSNRITVHFAVFNHLSLLSISETRWNFVIMFTKENCKSAINLRKNPSLPKK